MPLLPEEPPPAKHPCDGVRADLKSCLLATDCVMSEGKTPRECIRMHHKSIDEQCYALLNTFFECKRGMLDNRQRFRGSKGY